MSHRGMTEQQAREFLLHEVAKQESSTFYWENDEVEEVLDLIIDAVAKLIAANNAKLDADRDSEYFRAGL